MVEFPVTDLPSANPPTSGERAPDFVRPLVNEEYWEDTALSAVTETGPTMLCFLPMDGAFPTTYLWNAIDDHGFGTQLDLVGISISSPYEHKSLLAERSIEARLFSDPTATVASKYDLENELDGMTGVVEHRPAVFVLEPDRTIEYAWVATEWPAFPDYEEVADAIDAIA